MEMSMNKNEVNVSCCHDVEVKIQMNEDQFETVSSFKYLGANDSAEGRFYESY